MKDINAFDVFSEMIKRNDYALKLAPLGNILQARKVKAGTKVTFGCAGDIVGAILNGTLVGGFVLCDKAKFEALKMEMESIPAVNEEPEGKEMTRMLLFNLCWAIAVLGLAWTLERWRAR